VSLDGNGALLKIRETLWGDMRSLEGVTGVVDGRGVRERGRKWKYKPDGQVRRRFATGGTRLECMWVDKIRGGRE